MSANGGSEVDPAKAAMNDFIAGTVGGATGMVIGFPLDTAKTRLQAMPRFENSSAWRVIQETARVEGTTALYRGMSIPLCTSCFLNAVIFSVQGSVERWSEGVLGSDQKRLSGFLAGCIAGLVQSPFVAVSDLVKCQRQVQFAARDGSTPLLGPIGVVKQRVARLGLIQGTMQGLGATTLKECPSYGAYFLIYAEGQRIATDRLGWHAVPSTLLAGGLAGCIALGMIHPVDVVKSRVQALPVDAPPAERSALKIARDGLAREGSAFFLRGFGAAMQRAFILNAATFGGYELALAAITAR